MWDGSCLKLFAFRSPSKTNFVTLPQIDESGAQLIGNAGDHSKEVFDLINGSAMASHTDEIAPLHPLPLPRSPTSGYYRQYEHSAPNSWHCQSYWDVVQCRLLLPHQQIWRYTLACQARCKLWGKQVANVTNSCYAHLSMHCVWNDVRQNWRNSKFIKRHKSPAHQQTV